MHPSRRRSSVQGLNFGCFPERSGIAPQYPGHTRLDRFDCVSRDLLSERPEFLVLRRDRIELMTRMCSRKFYCLRWSLNGHELADKVESGIGIDSRHLDDLEAISRGPLAVVAQVASTMPVISSVVAFIFS
jgi:hypothetical protein